MAPRPRPRRVQYNFGAGVWFPDETLRGAQWALGFVAACFLLSIAVHWVTLRDLHRTHEQLRGAQELLAILERRPVQMPAAVSAVRGAHVTANLED